MNIVEGRSVAQILHPPEFQRFFGRLFLLDEVIFCNILIVLSKYGEHSIKDTEQSLAMVTNLMNLCVC